jgi:hypothetical protein
MKALIAFAALALVAVGCGDSAPTADPEKFCALSEELEAQDTTEMPFDEALEFIKAGRDKFAELPTVAPDEIKTDVEIVVAVALAFTDALIDVGGDPSRIDASTMDAIVDADGREEFSAANGRVESWTDANCAFRLGTT